MPLLLLFFDGKQSFGDELHHWKWNEFFCFWTFKVKMKEKWKKVLVFPAKNVTEGKEKVVSWAVRVCRWKGSSSEVVAPAGPGDGKVSARFWLLQRAAMWGAGARGHSKPLSWAAISKPPGQPWLSSSLVLSLLVRYGSLAGSPTSPRAQPPSHSGLCQPMLLLCPSHPFLASHLVAASLVRAEAMLQKVPCKWFLKWRRDDKNSLRKSILEHEDMSMMVIYSSALW